MCTAGAMQVHTPSYPVNVEVQMVGHFSDGNDRTFVKGMGDDQTWFVRYSEAYSSWITTVGPLSNAFSC